jgi:hypothetical protein
LALGLAAGAFCQTYVQFSVGSANFATGINEKGEIVGYYGDIQPIPGHFQGFVRDPNGKLTSFDPGFDTVMASINNKGAITGAYADITESHTQGFVRSPDGTITSFVPPFCNSTSTNPTSINDEGVITGSCFASGPFNILWVRFP